jgi:hypothetical protein
MRVADRDRELWEGSERQDGHAEPGSSPNTCRLNIAVSPIPLMSTRMTSASESRQRSWTGCNRRGLTWFLADP